MDAIEDGDSDKNATKSTETQVTNEAAVEEESSSKSKELKKVFTSKSQFKEFIQFVKNGFKIK